MNLKLLSAPFPAKDILWRVGQRSENARMGKALPYLSAQTIKDRLDDVIGPGKWCNSMQDVVTGNRHVAVRCTIGIFIDGAWVSKEDGAQVDVNVGGNAELVVKGAYSDAFKRAAVMWGIGRYLYSFQAPIVALDDQGQLAEVPTLPPEFLPEGDTTQGTIVKDARCAPAAVDESAHAGVATESAAAPTVAEPTESEAAAAQTPPQAETPPQRAAAQAAVEAVEAPSADVAQPAVPAVAVPAQPAEQAAAAEVDQSYTEAELEALPQRERQYVRSITSHLAKRTSLSNLRAYVNGPKMQQSLAQTTRERLTNLIDAAIGQQEMAA